MCCKSVFKHSKSANPTSKQVSNFGWRMLRWFPPNIRAIMAKVKLLKNPNSMVTFWIKVRRSYRDLSSQADPAKMLGDFIAGSLGEMSYSEKFQIVFKKLMCCE